MPGLPVSSILQCNWNHHEGACLELIQAIGRLESTFVEAHQASKMICDVRLLKAGIKTRLILDKIITVSNEVFNNFESNMAVGITKLCDPARKTAEGNDTVQDTLGSYILTPQLQAKQSDLWEIACKFMKLNTKAYWKDWLHKTQFSHNAIQFIAV